MFAGIEGERRVQNVLVDGKPIDPEATYTLAATRCLTARRCCRTVSSWTTKC